ncbi:unnamed protein product [Protopolystoma xenopodis]|uniref:Ribosomal RNA methyltransferase SPB1-like C-terminal domain-containing protein n=1 Tax=Protopolystoma xenopodis TaxID=117903 RepID=A0A3S5AE54_9PLAT|nr:unnamed protein product [Protopolystoma xenopodis]
MSKYRKLKRPLTSEEESIAQLLIHSRKSRREVIESGFNRHRFFDNREDLPDWFVHDEKKHCRMTLPGLPEAPVIHKALTPSATLMGRTLKKTEEAKARRKARIAKRLKRVRQRTEDIPDDLPEKEKWMQIKQMYKKAGLLGKKKRPFHLVVNRKGGARNRAPPPKGARIKLVDRRMKADIRGRARSDGPVKSRASRKGKAGKKNGRKNPSRGHSRSGLSGHSKA